MASELALQRAAQAWCTPTTKKIVMQTELAEAFADILDEVFRPAPAWKRHHSRTLKRNHSTDRNRWKTGISNCRQRMKLYFGRLIGLCIMNLYTKNKIPRAIGTNFYLGPIVIWTLTQTNAPLYPEPGASFRIGVTWDPDVSNKLC